MAEEIRETLAPCWTINPDDSATVVAIQASLDIDGMVLEVSPADRDRYRTDPTYRSAADRAIRAVLNPNCQPLPFSAEDWPSWQSVTIVFDPNLWSGGS